jgi:hypothetical protein
MLVIVVVIGTGQEILIYVLPNEDVIVTASHREKTAQFVMMKNDTFREILLIEVGARAQQSALMLLLMELCLHL